MRTLFSGGDVVNVFTGEIERKNVLVRDGVIVGVGDYRACDADEIVDVSGKTVCPGFIDGHIHIESSMLLPGEFAGTAVPHGTTAVVADPHEIANVCGKIGLDFMLESSEGVPLTFYIVLPSCVPATAFDESGGTLNPNELSRFYANPRVLGLGEVMNYNGVVAGDPELTEKIADAVEHKSIVNGHAPLLSGKALDAYIAAGITDDHECSSFEEAAEKIRKGQRVMIRCGTAARNLDALLPLFDEPYARRCLLVTDDKHPADLLRNGHIDEIIRKASAAGKNPVTGIRMATIQAAEYYGLKRTGAIAPGYKADILVLGDLKTVKVNEVYKDGVKVAENGKALPFREPEIDPVVKNTICCSFHLDDLTENDFAVDAAGIRKCRVIRCVPGQLLTDECIGDIDFGKNNGIDTGKDILKIAVIERHNRTGHIGLGYISGTGLTEGAIASSVAHDSHNIIVIGTNAGDMAFAANRIKTLGGGMVVANSGEVIAEMPLPYAGLMTDAGAATAAEQNENVRRAVYKLGAPENIEPFMTMAFLSLPVIPHLKITSVGLVDVDGFRIVPLFCD